VHTLVRLLAGRELDLVARAALDRGIVAAYNGAGITADPRTWPRPAPTLADLAAKLAADTDPAGPALAGRLAPYVDGTHRHLFDGPTTTRPDGHLVVISSGRCRGDQGSRHLARARRRVAAGDRGQPPAPARHRRRGLAPHAGPEGARFLQRLAKSARKHWCGLTVVTQDPADLLATDLGRAVVANAATQILLRQAPQSIAAVGEAFGLSDGERASSPAPSPATPSSPPAPSASPSTPSPAPPSTASPPPTPPSSTTSKATLRGLLAAGLTALYSRCSPSAPPSARCPTRRRN